MPKKAHKPSRHLYYVQPDGTWKKGADGRSGGKTLAEVKKIKGKIR
jgi:hypothetical protein